MRRADAERSACGESTGRRESGRADCGRRGDERGEAESTGGGLALYEASVASDRSSRRTSGDGAGGLRGRVAAACCMGCASSSHSGDGRRDVDTDMAIITQSPASASRDTWV